VLFVVRPGFGVTTGTLYAVAAGCCYGGFLTCNRWLGGIAPPRALLMSQLVIGALVLTPFGLPVIPAMTTPIAALTFASAALSMAGNLLLIFAYRRATASRLAPFIYFQLVSATTLGFIVFGTAPDNFTLTGLALLISSGVVSISLKRS
jgi:drug/metabolite transporter (DMT)-like permease